MDPNNAGPNKTQQKYLHDLMHQSFYDELVLMGFPYDQGAKNNQLRAGAYLGADSFRRFLNNNYGVLNNVEYGINIEDHLEKISDFGNITSESVQNGQLTFPQVDLEQLYDKLKNKSGLCLERNNRLFLVGGTKDLLKPLAQAYDKVSTESNRSVIVVLTNKLFGQSQQLAYGQLIDSESTTCRGVTSIFFGVNGEHAAQEAIGKDIKLDTERALFVDTRGSIDDLADLFEQQVLNSEAV